MSRSIADIKAANMRSGHFFFDAATMEHWRSVIYPETFDAGDGVTLFITSEALEGQTRRYAVRIAQANGRVIPLTDMRAIRIHDMAVVIAQAVSTWWRTDTGPESGTVDEWVARRLADQQ